MGLAASTLDFYDDSGALMTKLSAPAHLSKVHVHVLSPERRAALSDRDFGLVVITKHAGILRRFPIPDPGNTWLSAQYFDAYGDKLAMPARITAARTLKAACRAYDVPASDAVEKYAARADSRAPATNLYVEGSHPTWVLDRLAEEEVLSKQASAAEADALVNLPDSCFALVVHTGDGEVIRKYAMPDAAHLKKAAAYFDKYAMQLAPEHRHRFASSVKARAEELDVRLGDTAMLDKWASSGWSAHVHAHLEQRKSLLPRNDQARRALDKLAALIGETEPEMMARALDRLDRATKLDRYYDRGLADPFASTMGKVASGWSTEIDGHTLTEADLKKVATTRLAGYIGEGLAKELAAHPVEVFEELPASEQVLIAQLATGQA